MFGFTALAIAAVLAGLRALFGYTGAALGGLTMMLVGNPFSGVTSAPELLPRPGGAFGQLLPPGAGGSLLRSVAFFDGAASGRPLGVLAAWAALAWWRCGSARGGDGVRRRLRRMAPGRRTQADLQHRVGDAWLGGRTERRMMTATGARGRPHTTIRGAGHFLQGDRGEELARVVIDFLARSGAGGWPAERSSGGGAPVAG